MRYRLVSQKFCPAARCDQDQNQRANRRNRISPFGILSKKLERQRNINLDISSSTSQTVGTSFWHEAEGRRDANVGGTVILAWMVPRIGSLHFKTKFRVDVF